MKSANRLLALAFILLVSVFLSAGCDWFPARDARYPQRGTIPDEQALPADYFPLALGSRWQYQGEGNEYASFNREVVFTEGNRGQVADDNGGAVSSLVFEVTDTAVTIVYRLREEFAGQNLLDQRPNENTVIMKAPLRTGTRWTVGDETHEIIDDQASVRVPAGTFKPCLAIRITRPDSTSHEYYYQGIGLIKREFDSEGYKVTSSMENYQLGPASPRP